MKKKIKKTLFITIIAVSSVFLFYEFLYTPLMMYGTLYIYGKKTIEGKRRLLYETHHVALLEACRVLYNKGYRGEYVFGGKHDFEPDNMPEALIMLKPRRILINKDKIVVAMIGGMETFGVYAYPENFKVPFKGYNIGDKKLVDGLWYFDTGYRGTDKNEYEKFLQSLKPESKRNTD